MGRCPVFIITVSAVSGYQGLGSSSLFLSEIKELAFFLITARVSVGFFLSVFFFFSNTRIENTAGIPGSPTCVIFELVKSPEVILCG